MSRHSQSPCVQPPSCSRPLVPDQLLAVLPRATGDEKEKEKEGGDSDKVAAAGVDDAAADGGTNEPALTQENEKEKEDGGSDKVAAAEGGADEPALTQGMEEQPARQEQQAGEDQGTVDAAAPPAGDFGIQQGMFPFMGQVSLLCLMALGCGLLSAISALQMRRACASGKTRILAGCVVQQSEDCSAPSRLLIVACSPHPPRPLPQVSRQ